VQFTTGALFTVCVDTIKSKHKKLRHARESERLPGDGLATSGRGGLQSGDFLLIHLCLLSTWGDKLYVDSFSFGPCCSFSMLLYKTDTNEYTLTLFYNFD
jgi:hypothetical protein